MNIRNEVRKMKEDSPKMAALSLETRNQALKAAALALQEHKEEIFQANKEDMEDVKSSDEEVGDWDTINWKKGVREAQNGKKEVKNRWEPKEWARPLPSHLAPGLWRKTPRPWRPNRLAYKK